MAKTLDQLSLANELAGNRCQCGAVKVEHTTFCNRCYFKLPLPMRLALWLQNGDGYTKAYQAAILRLGPSE